MINKIRFKNYKCFEDTQELELRPITVLIGKNSAGKSAVCRLPTLIEGSLSGNFDDPLLVVNEGVELGAEFRDLVYGRSIGSIEFDLISGSECLAVEITSGLKDSAFPTIRKWNLNNELSLLFDDNNKKYISSESTKAAMCLFRGFEIQNLTDVENELDLSSLNSLKSRGISLKTNYIGPFRQIPERTYNVTGPKKLSKIGYQGENAYQILISDFVNGDGELLSKVNDWYTLNFDGWGIQVNTNSKPDYRIELTRRDSRLDVNIRDVGQGMSQALPLIVSAYLEHRSETLTIIEQPELHLHPGAHGNLAELFAESIKSSSHHFLIETHSQNFILRLRRLIAEGRLDKNSVMLYSVEFDSDSNSSSLKKILITDDGGVSYWPENVFGESLDETIAIRTAQIKRDKDES